MGKPFPAFRGIKRASWLKLTFKRQEAKPESYSPQNILGRELSSCQISADRDTAINSLQKQNTWPLGNSKAPAHMCVYTHA